MPIHVEAVSWQLEQPLLTPAWICAEVGAGVAKRVPGALVVALAAISPEGALARWQVSHVVDEGMCEPAPAGLVGGIVTMRVMPAKLEPVTLGPWQAAQPFVIPAWFMREALNFAPLGTGSAAMLDPVPTWQLSHAAVVGMWLPGIPTMLKFLAGIAKLAAAAP